MSERGKLYQPLWSSSTGPGGMTVQWPGQTLCNECKQKCHQQTSVEARLSKREMWLQSHHLIRDAPWLLYVSAANPRGNIRRAAETAHVAEEINLLGHFAQLLN